MNRPSKGEENVMAEPTHRSHVVSATSYDVVQDKHEDGGNHESDQTDEAENVASNPPCLDKLSSKGVVNEVCTGEALS